MNTPPDPIPGVSLSRRDVDAIAALRADGKPWPAVVEKLELLPEHQPGIDLLPLFHPDWADAYAAATEKAEDALFAEAQLVTRRQIKYAGETKVRRAAVKRAGRHRPRGTRDRPPPPNPGGALAYRLARGETADDIGARYLAGLPDAGPSSPP